MWHAHSGLMGNGSDTGTGTHHVVLQRVGVAQAPRRVAEAPRRAVAAGQAAGRPGRGARGHGVGVRGREVLAAVVAAQARRETGRRGVSVGIPASTVGWPTQEDVLETR